MLSVVAAKHTSFKSRSIHSRPRSIGLNILNYALRLKLIEASNKYCLVKIKIDSVVAVMALRGPRPKANWNAAFSGSGE